MLMAPQPGRDAAPSGGSLRRGAAVSTVGVSPADATFLDILQHRAAPSGLLTTLRNPTNAPHLLGDAQGRKTLGGR
jgi:hypothetical protein